MVLFDLGTKDIVSANSLVEIPELLQKVNDFFFFQTMMVSIVCVCVY